MLEVAHGAIHGLSSFLIGMRPPVDSELARSMTVYSSSNNGQRKPSLTRELLRVIRRLSAQKRSHRLTKLISAQRTLDPMDR
jgi:hypothetical protein